MLEERKWNLDAESNPLPTLNNIVNYMLDMPDDAPEAELMEKDEDFQRTEVGLHVLRWRLWLSERGIEVGPEPIEAAIAYVNSYNN